MADGAPQIPIQMLYPKIQQAQDQYSFANSQLADQMQAKPRSLAEALMRLANVGISGYSRSKAQGNLVNAEQQAMQARQSQLAQAMAMVQGGDAGTSLDQAAPGMMSPQAAQSMASPGGAAPPPSQPMDSSANSVAPPDNPQSAPVSPVDTSALPPIGNTPGMPSPPPGGAFPPAPSGGGPGADNPASRAALLSLTAPQSPPGGAAQVPFLPVPAARGPVGMPQMPALAPGYAAPSPLPSSPSPGDGRGTSNLGAMVAALPYDLQGPALQKYIEGMMANHWNYDPKTNMLTNGITGESRRPSTAPQYEPDLSIQGGYLVDPHSGIVGQATPPNEYSVDPTTAAVIGKYSGPTGEVLRARPHTAVSANRAYDENAAPSQEGFVSTGAAPLPEWNQIPGTPYEQNKATGETRLTNARQFPDYQNATPGTVPRDRTSGETAPGATQVPPLNEYGPLAPGDVMANKATGQTAAGQHAGLTAPIQQEVIQMDKDAANLDNTLKLLGQAKALNARIPDGAFAQKEAWLSQNFPGSSGQISRDSANFQNALNSAAATSLKSTYGGRITNIDLQLALKNAGSDVTMNRSARAQAIQNAIDRFTAQQHQLIGASTALRNGTYFQDAQPSQAPSQPPRHLRWNPQTGSLDPVGP